MIYDTQKITKPRLEVEYYGADFPVDVLVKRMEAEDFIIPDFQRGYVWKDKQASKFIESLLIGLPTPTLFLAKDKFSNKYLVIDGQQRLKTLQYFYQEAFPDQKVFKLRGVVDDFKGLTYSKLSSSDRRCLDNAIIHCIIISDHYDPNGMFYLFERLNTTGTPLTTQEIRNAIYHGAFSDLLKELSSNEVWRELCNEKDEKDDRGKAQELILRFLALYFDLDNYSRDMTNFLNSFMLKNKDFDLISKEEIANSFLNTINFIRDCIGLQAFYPRNKKPFNIGVYETLMVFTAKELQNDLDCQKLSKLYDLLVNDQDFWSFAKHSTTSKKNIQSKLNRVNELYQNMQ